MRKHAEISFYSPKEHTEEKKMKMIRSQEEEETLAEWMLNEADNHACLSVNNDLDIAQMDRKNIDTRAVYLSRKWLSKFISCHKELYLAILLDTEAYRPDALKSGRTKRYLVWLEKLIKMHNIQSI